MFTCYSTNYSIDQDLLARGINSIDFTSVFGISPNEVKTYFAFESQHTSFQKYVAGSLPRTDLVIQDSYTGQCLRGLEVKLTALPDNTTALPLIWGEPIC